MEIERKFIPDITNLDLESYDSYYLEQGYISTNPVIRIRKKKSKQDASAKYILTIKSSGMLKREEYEMQLTADEYDNLKTKVVGNMIAKTRYHLPLPDGYLVELDVFDDLFKGLQIAEIEFPNEELATSYNPPEYLKKEVTYDTHFHNSTLSGMEPDQITEFLKSL